MDITDLIDIALRDYQKHKTSVTLSIILRKYAFRVPDRDFKDLENRLISEDLVSVTHFSKTGNKYLLITDKGRRYAKIGYPKALLQETLYETTLEINGGIGKLNAVEKAEMNDKKNALKRFIDIRTELSVALEKDSGTESVVAKIDVLLKKYQAILSSQPSSMVLYSHYPEKMVPLIDRIVLELEIEIEQVEPIMITNEKIRAVTEQLFRNGHYPDAVFKAFKTVEIEVRSITGIDKYGADLMAEAFSAKNPKILISKDTEVQQGVMFLYQGAMKGIRNSEGHKNTDCDREQANALLHFASLLMRWAQFPKSFLSF
jgi:uncharacterized protein (TIGR02391 family)